MLVPLPGYDLTRPTPSVCVFSHPLRFEAFTNDVMLPEPGWQVRPEPARGLFAWAVHNARPDPRPVADYEAAVRALV